MMWYVGAALASGGLVGFSLGLVGGDGSILATPLLLYVVGVAQPHIAIGTGALAVSVNAFANLIGQTSNGGALSSSPSSGRLASLPQVSHISARFGCRSRASPTVRSGGG
jgi:hypothetical protein